MSEGSHIYKVYLAGDVGGRLALLQPAGESHAHPIALGEAQHGAHGAGDFSFPYDRGDDFSKPKLQPVWQWNHLPDEAKWPLTERPGYLRLHSLPAAEFWWAQNSLT